MVGLVRIWAEVEITSLGATGVYMTVDWAYAEMQCAAEGVSAVARKENKSMKG